MIPAASTKSEVEALRTALSCARELAGGALLSDCFAETPGRQKQEFGPRRQDTLALALYPDCSIGGLSSPGREEENSMAEPVYTPFYVLCPRCPALHGPMRGRDVHAFVCECEGAIVRPSPFKFSPYAQPRIVGYGSHRKALSPAQRAVADRLLGLSAPVGDYGAWDRAHPAATSGVSPGKFLDAA